MDISNETRAALTQALGQLMADVSRACWGVDWMAGTEQVLPVLCEDVLEADLAFTRDGWTVDLETARACVTLAQRLGHWVTRAPDGDGFVPYTPDAAE
jgi:hypothetical protein